MIGLIKGTLRMGVFGLLAVGALGAGAYLVAGPQRTKAVIGKVQSGVLEKIDRCIDDPTALRAQLQELEREYPAKIGQVRGDLAELQEQIRQLEREHAICERVVAMTERDLGELEPALAEASAAFQSGEAPRGILVSFDDHVYTFDRARSKVGQVRQTRIAYTNRAADAKHDLTYLRQQAERLEDLLMQLENERAQFQGQIAQLGRQVDAIERNDRLIGLLEKRNRTIEECSRYDAESLDQITSRLSEIRSRQEAELDHLASSQRQLDYEDLARIELQGETLETTTPDVLPGASIAGAHRR